jgi:uncharacterized protein (DUF983 family)
VKNNPSDYGSDVQIGDIPAYINVGIVPTTGDASVAEKVGTGRIVTFPNWVQVSVVIYMLCLETSGQLIALFSIGS